MFLEETAQPTEFQDHHVNCHVTSDTVWRDSMAEESAFLEIAINSKRLGENCSLALLERSMVLDWNRACLRPSSLKLRGAFAPNSVPTAT